MNMQIVNLYQYFGREPDPNGTGTLHLYVPQRLHSGRRLPAVLVLPGGGYEHVSWRESQPVALHLAARGYAAFVLQYSVSPCRYPVALREVAMAMAYIRTNADALGIDPHMVAAMGFSAGGHLCGCLGTLYDREVVADIAPAEMLRPDILSLCYPVAVSWGRTHAGSFQNLTGGDEKLWHSLSLEKLVRPDMPPVFLWHTRADASVPCRNSLLLAQSLEEAGVPFALHIYHKGPHGLSVADETVYPEGQMPEISPDVPGWLALQLQFFREHGFRILDKEV